MGVSISVIIPCFRCARIIGRAIQSVAAQTVIPREVILVDDASDDGTLDVLRQFQIQYGQDWIRILRLENNTGPATARNIAWDNAISDYVAFLDADDTWHPKKIEIQYNWMKNNPEAKISGHLCLVLPEGGVPPPIPKQWAVRRVNLRKLLFSNPYSTPTVMLRQDLPFRFLDKQRFSEDYLLWSRIILTGNPAYLLDIPMAFLFKARYGAMGLSANLWNMEKGELFNYRQLRQERLISAAYYPLLTFCSLSKYAYRRMRIKSRRII